MKIFKKKPIHSNIYNPNLVSAFATNPLMRTWMRLWTMELKILIKSNGGDTVVKIIISLYCPADTSVWTSQISHQTCQTILTICVISGGYWSWCMGGHLCPHPHNIDIKILVLELKSIYEELIKMGIYTAWTVSLHPPARLLTSMVQIDTTVQVRREQARNALSVISRMCTGKADECKISAESATQSILPATPL